MNIAVHIRSVCFLTMAVISLHTGSAQDSLYFANETAARVPVNIQLSSSVSVGDVDGDGDLDIVVGNFCIDPGYGCTNRLLINDGAGYFTDESGLRLPYAPDETTGVSLCDVDNDDDLDILFSNLGNNGTGEQNRLLINDGTGYFTDESAERLPGDMEPSISICCADVNGDMFIDLVVSNLSDYTNHLLMNDGEGYFTESLSMPTGTDTLTSYTYLSTDVDGDFHLDLVMINGWNSFSISQDDLLLLNDGSGNFSYSPNPLPNDTDISRTATVFDLNGDHINDLIIPKVEQSRLYFSDGLGGYADVTEGRLPETYNSFAIVVSDLSGNGLADIFSADISFDLNQLFLNTGDNFFTDISDRSLPSLPWNSSRDTETADFDGDGDLDIFIAAQGDMQNKILINEGNVPDTTLPVIRFDEVHSVIHGNQVRVFVQDNMRWLRSVEMVFRPVGEDLFTHLQMRAVGGSLYQADMSGYNGISLEFYFTATDCAENQALYPADAPSGYFVFTPSEWVPPAGDLNLDTELNILDIVILVEIILEITLPDENQQISGDVNSDGVMDILDILALVELIMG